MNKHTEYNLCESRSARCNVKVASPARWRLIAEFLLSSPIRTHRYRDISRRMLEETIHNYHCRKPCS